MYGEKSKNAARAVTFKDIQAMLDAVLGKSTWQQNHPGQKPQTHGIFWRQTGNYDQDYTAFTTGNVPGVGLPIMNTAAGQGLQSNIYLVLMGTSDDAPQMPLNGPFITDANYSVTVNGVAMSGQDIQNALGGWLTSGFPK